MACPIGGHATARETQASWHIGHLLRRLLCQLYFLEFDLCFQPCKLTFIAQVQTRISA